MSLVCVQPHLYMYASSLQHVNKLLVVEQAYVCQPLQTHLPVQRSASTRAGEEWSVCSADSLVPRPVFLLD